MRTLRCFKMPTIFAGIAAITGLGATAKGAVESRKGRKRQKALSAEAAARSEQIEKDIKAAPGRAEEAAKKRARRIRARQTKTILTGGAAQELTTAGKTLLGE